MSAAPGPYTAHMPREPMHFASIVDCHGETIAAVQADTAALLAASWDLREALAGILEAYGLRYSEPCPEPDCAVCFAVATLDEAGG